MPSFDEITRHHVLQAMREYDDLGAPQFLPRYGFGKSRNYLLVHDGRSYDSKAILGVAHRFATGRQAESGEFSGGRYGAAAVLESLGFEVQVDGDEVVDGEAPRAPATGRKPATRQRAVEQAVPTCPTCHMALPKTGVCDNCD